MAVDLNTSAPHSADEGVEDFHVHMSGGVAVKR
jgi:hypothetical protein